MLRVNPPAVVGSGEALHLSDPEDALPFFPLPLLRP